MEAAKNRRASLARLVTAEPTLTVREMGHIVGLSQSRVSAILQALGYRLQWVWAGDR